VPVLVGAAALGTAHCDQGSRRLRDRFLTREKKRPSRTCEERRARERSGDLPAKAHGGHLLTYARTTLDETGPASIAHEVNQPLPRSSPMPRPVCAGSDRGKENSRLNAGRQFGGMEVWMGLGMDILSTTAIRGRAK